MHTSMLIHLTDIQKAILCYQQLSPEAKMEAYARASFQLTNLIRSKQTYATTCVRPREENEVPDIEYPPLYNALSQPRLVLSIKLVFMTAFKELLPKEASLLELDCETLDFPLWHSNLFQSVCIMHRSLVTSASLSLQLAGSPFQGSHIYCDHADLAQKLNKNVTFDFVVSLFSLQRHFKSEETANTFFANLRAVMKPGAHCLCFFQSGSELLRRKGEATRSTKRTKPEPYGNRLYGTKQMVMDLDKTPLLATLRQSIEPVQSEEDYLVFCSTLLERHVLKSKLVPVKKWPESLSGFIESSGSHPIKRLLNLDCSVAILLKKESRSQ